MLEVQIPHFLMDLDDSKKRLFEDSMNGPTPDVPIQDIFALYRRTKTLLGMYKAFCPKYVHPRLYGCNDLTSLMTQVARLHSTLAASSSRMFGNGL